MSIGALVIPPQVHHYESDVQALRRCESTIARGLKTFLEVGNALLEIKDRRLYRTQYSTFQEYCDSRWGISARHANRLVAAVGVVRNLGPMGPVPDSERQVRPLVELAPQEQRLAWEVVRLTAPGGNVTASHVESVVDVLKEITETGGIDAGDGEQISVSELVNARITEETYERMMRHKQHIVEAIERKNNPQQYNSGNCEHYTPPEIITKVRAVLRVIDLDPASCSMANQTVCATTYYAIEDDGLSHEWSGRVFLNPPYSNMDEWTDKLLDSPLVTESITLSNNATEAEWCQRLMRAAQAVCFPSGRIRFVRPSGERGHPLQGQMITYCGDNADVFNEQFREIGMLWKR